MEKPLVTVVVHHESTRLGWLAAYLEGDKEVDDHSGQRGFDPGAR